MPDTRIKLLSTSGSTDPVPQLHDGVWLNLSDEAYFGQEERLGSTDLCNLFLKREGWWWQSHYNAAAEQDRNVALGFGKALHKAVLEGERAFREAVAVAPDKVLLRAQHGDRFCVTVKDIVTALEARGMHPKANQPKDWFIEYCRQRAPDLVIWDSVVAAAERAAAGKILITEAERRDIEMMAAIVHNHQEVGPLFDYGPSNKPLAEVSMLWTDEHGLRRRVRLDLLLPQNIIDLKSIGNVGNRKLPFYAGEHVASLAYHVQMADHLLARRWMLRFIQDGRVFDGHPEDLRSKESAERFEDQLAWLKRFPTEAPNSDYAWIFVQKPDAKNGHAPIVFPWGEDLGGELHLRGIRCRREAIATYRRCMEQFGPHEPWVRVEPLHTTREGRGMARVFLPAWIGGDEALPDEMDDV